MSLNALDHEIKAKAPMVALREGDNPGYPQFDKKLVARNNTALTGGGTSFECRERRTKWGLPAGAGISQGKLTENKKQVHGATMGTANLLRRTWETGPDGHGRV